ncbi:MAG: hypothetical protein Harvfovirus39_8 [Harvfovirus sp.]|uniref:Exonuclease domain-containing protein n=1 Tax=Harvfovirus sp. TaxID=2487768 RepID=A0A3G5A7V6_9VIRU|nr:MAG: hypothetical protein Harvfovirus39_8 [Harvfovirus sp.]
MRCNFDYLVAIDTEFTGVDVVRNQIVSIGMALLDVKQGRVIETMKIGEMRLEAGRGWDLKCRAFWDGQEGMRDIARSLDEGLYKMTLQEGTEQFVMTVRDWELKYYFGGKALKWGFLVDTNSTDVSHMNATLGEFGFNSLVMLFGDRYRDVFCLKSLIAAVNAVGGSEKGAEPVNLVKHDPVFDAVHIAEMAVFLIRRLENFEKKQKIVRYVTVAGFGSLAVSCAIWLYHLVKN